MLAGVVDDLTERVEAQVRVTVPLVTTALDGPRDGGTLRARRARRRVPQWLALLARGRGDDGRWPGGSRPAARTTWRAARGEVTRCSELVASQALDLQAVGAVDAAVGWLRDGPRPTSRSDPAAEPWTRDGRGSHADGHRARHHRVCAGRGPRVTATAPVLGPAGAGALRAGRGLRRPARGRPGPGAGAGGRTAGCTTCSTPAQPSRSRVTAPDRRPRLRGQRPIRARRRHGEPRTSGCVASRAAWDGERSVVGPVDLDVEPGSVVAVTGPSGLWQVDHAGRAGAAARPDAGSYTVDGQDALSLPLERCASLFAVVDDEPHVFATTVRENLLLARAGRRRRPLSLRALGDAGLRAWRDGLAGRARHPARVGGRRSQRWRARPGCRSPGPCCRGRPVLLLDEPVAHLDHPTAVAVLTDLLAARGGRSVVVVSHRPEGIDGADHSLTLGLPVTGGGRPRCRRSPAGWVEWVHEHHPALPRHRRLHRQHLPLPDGRVRPAGAVRARPGSTTASSWTRRAPTRGRWATRRTRGRWPCWRATGTTTSGGATTWRAGSSRHGSTGSTWCWPPTAGTCASSPGWPGATPSATRCGCSDRSTPSRR